VYSREAQRASLKIQDDVIRLLNASGVSARIDFPGFVQIKEHAFVHWHGRSEWTHQCGSEQRALLLANHTDAREIAGAIGQILKAAESHPG